MRRLFTDAEIDAYLPHTYEYVTQEFGEEDCIPLERLRRYRAVGALVYQPYGDISPPAPPTVLGIANCVLIAEEELAAMQRRERKETELEPWIAGSGPAVLWVASVVSEIPGVAAKCISGILDQVQAHPHKTDIRKIAVVCTGPQGYLMSDAFGLALDGFEYREGWPFMERTIDPDSLDGLGRQLQSVWNMTKVRDVIRRGRETWGRGWRDQVLASSRRGS